MAAFGEQHPTPVGHVPVSDETGRPYRHGGEQKEELHGGGGGGGGAGGSWTIRKSATQSLPSATVTQITYDLAEHDSGEGVIDLANNRLVVPTTGRYLLLEEWHWSTAKPSAACHMVAQVNGVDIHGYLRIGAAAIDSGVLEGSYVVDLAEGDLITVVANPSGTTASEARGHADTIVSTKVSLVRL